MTTLADALFVLCAFALVLSAGAWIDEKYLKGKVERCKE